MSGALGAWIWLLALQSPEQKLEGRFVQPSWSGWSGFQAGSFVTMEVESGGQKARLTTTLKKKEDLRLTLEEVLVVGGERRPAREKVISKPRGTPGVYDSIVPCSKCKKPWSEHKKPEFREGKEKIKISGKEVLCDTSDGVYYDCEGKEEKREKYAYSDALPGNLVLIDVKSKAVTYTLTCVEFEKK